MLRDDSIDGNNNFVGQIIGTPISKEDLIEPVKSCKNLNFLNVSTSNKYFEKTQNTKTKITHPNNKTKNIFKNYLYSKTMTQKKSLSTDNTEKLKTTFHNARLSNDEYVCRRWWLSSCRGPSPG